MAQLAVNFTLQSNRLSSRARTANLTLAGALLTCALATLLGSNQAQAETAYISDKLTVPVRSGPTKGHRIVHFGLPAGTKMEILARDEASEFVEIETAGGTKGWIRGQYITAQPIARDRLRSANAKIAALEKSLNREKTALTAAKAAGNESSKTSSQLNQQLTDTTQKLEALQKISKNAIAEHAENQKLKGLNSSLLDQLEDIKDERDQLRSNVQQRWLMIGGGLVLIGLLLGILLKARPRRSAWT